MGIFRGNFTRYTVLLFMGLTFLNSSFLQLEIRLLRRVTGINMSLSMLAEVLEEKGASGEGEDDQNDKDTDLIFHPSTEHSYYCILHSKNTMGLILEASLHRGYLKKFSPPPEG